jgi:hypothetical protein
LQQFFIFWWICTKKAFWGNTAFANDWQWVFGIPVCSGVAAAFASHQGVDALSVGSPIADGFLAALGAFVVTWILSFLVRLGNAPVVLFYAEQKRAETFEQEIRKTAVVLERDIGISEAVGYVAFREWNKSFKDVAGSSDVSGGPENDEVWQALADGVVPSWGKRDEYGVHEPIPASYWFANKVEWFSLLRGRERTQSNVSSFTGDQYTSVKTSRTAVENYWPEIGASGSRALSLLKITFGMGDGFSSSQRSNPYQYKRVLSFKLENRGPRTVTNCRVIIESTDNDSVADATATLLDGATIAPGQHIFVPLVVYGEPFEPDKSSGDSFACVANANARPLFDVGESVLVSLRATGVDTPPLHRKCRVWVSKEKRLQIANEW